ncbi:hypothetical protein VTN77DRAFT_236 [Rasamsonia byssochlamydoides]|uniref:uncharacterized protein n=1 Tax=Rasamsonia byssochlamydoides TaxID=89139 RepID=UPI0037431066
MATTEPSHLRSASKSSVSAFDAARARIRKDDQFEPHTPGHRNRSLISSFGSSSSALSFRNEEDAIIFEFGSRWLRAGFEGESAPMCVVGFGPEESRKVGDYRGWIRRTEDERTANRHAQAVDAEQWAKEHELWRMDLRDLDLGLVEDKIERAVREIYNKYLLTDAGNARLVLVMPSVMPHPLLSAVLTTLFNRWRFPSITLLPSAAMATAAAGLRSALVVDIGWAETVVTAIYEYREIAARRSTRAMKLLMQQTGRMLSNLDSSVDQSPLQDEISVKFEYCEEVVTRFAWCKSDERDERFNNRNIAIPSPSNPDSAYAQVPFPKFAEPVEEALFAAGVAEHDLDDHDKPIHILVYNTLLALPPDVRGTCMSRIVFVGGGSKIPGIRQRVMKDVASLVEKHGWSAMRGRAVEEHRKKLQELSINRQRQPPPPPPPQESTPDSSISPSEAEETTPSTSDAKEDEEENQKEEEELDFVEQKLRRNRDKDTKPFVHGVFRQIESLGAWAGASLVTSLKVRGLVEIEREKFLQHGLSSASRDLDGHHHGHGPDRRSGIRSGGGGGGDRSSWTLAGWG